MQLLLVVEGEVVLPVVVVRVVVPRVEVNPLLLSLFSSSSSIYYKHTLTLTHPYPPPSAYTY